MNDHIFSTLDYLRAHQFLYYCLQREVISDREFDMFGRWSGHEYKGGSDLEESYTTLQCFLAKRMLNGDAPLFPSDYQP